MIGKTKWQKIAITGALTILVFAGIGIGIGILNKEPVNAQATGSEGEDIRTITVQGIAEKYGKPSIATLNLGVVSQGANMEEAQKDNNPKVEAVLAELKAQGIEEKDIQTSGYYVNPRYDQESWSTVIGYEINNMINVTVRDIDKAGEILDAAIAKGANASHGISFDLTTEDKDRLYKEALKEAVLQGEGNAKVLAESVNATIGNPIRVIEGAAASVDPFYYASDAKEAAYSGAGTSISPGELKVTATVTLVYKAK